MSNYTIIRKPAYRAIGLKWDGPWSEINKLKETIQTLEDRVKELPHAVQPDMQLGLSYHTRPDGFCHYSVYEVTETQQIPDGMLEINIPELTYVVTKHQKGDNIGDTYGQLAFYLNKEGYTPYKEPGVTYFDSLPIKHERYPLDRDKDDPHFEILIPIEKINS
ncbi:MAG: GyrI-like domain-containing protein [Bacillus sp. (in: Bacteria)]|nr:GyrI-like domain-containing protein [Bacillus sp. (in: firmicutes)]